MNHKEDYLDSITEIRSMMERSSQFFSLSGWAGIMAGVYALAGVGIAYFIYNFNPDKIFYSGIEPDSLSSNLPKIIILAIVVLILALVTAIYFSFKKAKNRGEKIWNATSRRLLSNMAVPLISGAVLIIIFISEGLIGLIAPLTLLFYGLTLYNASKFTIDEVKFLGTMQIGLGLINSYFIEYGLLFWAIGFGVLHIIYGIYMHIRYEG